MTHPARAWLSLLLFGLCCGLLCPSGLAQTDPKLAELKKNADALISRQRLTEALPLLEKIVATDPGDVRARFNLGFALIAQGTSTTDPTQRKALRVQARAAFAKAKELGLQDPLVDAMISSLPADGADSPAFSPNIAANALMIEAEGFFSQGKLDDALANYTRALELDPKLYHAALFAGDTLIQKGDFAQGQTWYQRAIAIDPDKETAYRYSATPLMRQGEFDAARDRYVEAFITEPYNQFALSGLAQWGKTTQTALAHPAIDIPVEVTFDEKGNAKVTVDPSKAGGADAGGAAWNAYGPARQMWKQGQFAKKFPGEAAYRHSLAEEADALGRVLALAASDKTVKTLNPTLAKLKRLNEEGLLEAYILLARPDAGIALDYPAYLKGNREKLRRYMLEYVVKGGGN